MKTSQSKKLEQLPYILAILALIFAAIQSANANETTMVIITSILIGVNAAAIFAQNKYPVFLPITVNLLNAIQTFYLVWMLFQAGKNYLPYAYIIAGCGFLFAAIFFAFKNRSNSETSS